MKIMEKSLVLVVAIASACAMLTAQAPGGAKGGGKGGPKGPALSVTSPAWADGGEVPMNNAGRGGNKSPMFEFHWSMGNNPAAAPATLQTYAIIFHDIENSTNKTTEDTLHWSAFNIPGTTKSLPEGLAGGDLPDGTRNGPGIMASGRHAVLFRTGRRRGTVPSLRVRVLRSGHQAGSAGHRFA